MSLAMTLGIQIGVRRTLWMMAGELAGIVVVATAALVGVAALLVAQPQLFALAKLAGAAYLLYAAVSAWRSDSFVGNVATTKQHTVVALAAQGFITATSNPKAWIFFAALLPPFVNGDRPLLPQGVTLVSIMVIIEFACMLLYAQGGRMLKVALVQRGLGRWLNRLSACLMAAIAVWLVVV
ncbi:LysE family translocator [bacterium]|nr:LysE family translocator [bacterium]